MSESWQIALFSGIGAILGAIILAGTRAAFLLSNRITRLETQFEDWLDRFGVVAAKMLHSPNNHLGIDYYLDQYVEHHYDMSSQQWIDFHEVCTIAMNNSLASKNEKLLAEMMVKLCEHKMKRDGIPLPA